MEWLFERNPLKTLFILFIGLIYLVVGVVGLKVILFPVQMASEAIDVTHDQLAPKELLRKYEMFKNMSASLDNYQANIQVYEARLKSAEKLGGNDRANIERLTLIESELSGIKIGYNSLAAEYNASMSKFNYSFTNVGSLPQGATGVLPREYRVYITQ